MGLCHPGQRSQWWLRGGPRNLEEFYGAQASPFRSWLCGVLMIYVILVNIRHSLIKYTKCVIGTILSEGIHECNISLEPRQKYLNFGMMTKGFSTFKNVLEAN